jgi:hypothetical protein
MVPVVCAEVIFPATRVEEALLWVQFSAIAATEDKRVVVLKATKPKQKRVERDFLWIFIIV